MSACKWSCVLCTFTLMPVLAVRAAPPGKDSNSPGVARLKAQFDAADLDHNALLDRDELAKVFRGPKAKAPTQDMYDDEGKLTKVYYDAPRKYPGLVFLWSADTNGDGFVSWPEFRDFELKLQQAQQQRQQALQRLIQSTVSRWATRSQPRRTPYPGGPSHASAQAMRTVQHQQQGQQQQIVRAVQNWQNNQRRLLAAYQTVLRQRLQEQQQLLNYVRERQATFLHAVQQRAAAAQRGLPRRYR